SRPDRLTEQLGFSGFVRSCQICPTYGTGGFLQLCPFLSDLSALRNRWVSPALSVPVRFVRLTEQLGFSGFVRSCPICPPLRLRNHAIRGLLVPLAILHLLVVLALLALADRLHRRIELLFVHRRLRVVRDQLVFLLEQLVFVRRDRVRALVQRQ